jgi:hypothetical protein
MTTENVATNDSAAVAEQGGTVAPDKASSTNGTNQKRAGTKGQRAAKRGKPSWVVRIDLCPSCADAAGNGIPLG